MESFFPVQEILDTCGHMHVQVHMSRHGLNYGSNSEKG